MKTQINGRPVSPQEKAARINLDRKFYGTFAEIGAGQEVARWFFVVGGASGTLAKTISAYDMAFSDAIYGKDERYVSQARLKKMLDYEFDLLVERLGSGRAFFAFADTVAARNHLGTNECHGWMGIKFQAQPQAGPSEIILHVNMRDGENIRQQEALGIIGVNLTYGAFYLHSEPEKLIASLLDGLSTARIEVDMVKFAGPCFSGVDNRLMSLQLVAQG
ncbi:MAG: TonB-dependent receptor, partial [Elusimicrobiota bacterium]